MPVPPAVLHARRHRRPRAQSHGLHGLRRAGLIAVTLATLLLGAGFTSLAGVYLQAASDLPRVDSLAGLFGPAGQEVYRPARLFDRSGQVLLFDLVHPLAADREWQPLSALPHSVADATVAALDPSFWTNRGYPSGSIERSLWAVLAGNDLGESGPTLTERLIDQTLTTAADARRAEPARVFRTALLAAEATERFPKTQLLEWFVNSADYGQLAFGIDAASLVYFGKHADQLSLAEVAALASVPAHPDVNPIDDPAGAEVNRQAVLLAMGRLGLLTVDEARRARQEELQVRREESHRALDGLGFVVHAWNELKDRLGPGLALQGALTVVTTLDTDLQLQTDCLLRTQLGRLAGGEATGVAAAADGSTCVAAGLLPLPRPGDAGRDLGAARAAAIVLDASTGEILALSGPADEARPAGTAIDPFIYLTAFAEGYTPATMVIDAPISGEPAPAATSHGPTRMRVALANSYDAATERVLSLAGADNVARTSARMGLTSLDASDEGHLGPWTAEGFPLSLTELAYAYLPLAGRGQMEGIPPADPADGLTPYLVRSVLGPDGTVLYSAHTESRTVLSESLAFLVDDILSDEAVRRPTYGQGSALDVGRPAAVQVGRTESGAEQWTVGFTPSRVVAVRVSSADGTAMDVPPLSGGAPVWQALMRYATRSLPPEGWQPPADLSAVEVCDPSGFLPTPYCPNVVKEWFLAGTEPTRADTLYQPFPINRETGKLATLFTPPELVDERVFFVPPAEAEAWARQAGIEAPPTDYDTYAPPPSDPDVLVSSPAAFDEVRGEIPIRGTAAGDGFDVYRLRYGQGLNPRAWVQVGADGERPLREATLGRWDTGGLDGLFTLQLMVVRDDGTVKTAYIPVTVDNTPPEIRLVLPTPGSRFTWPDSREILIQAEVSDASGIVQVEFQVDGRTVGTSASEPWSFRWPLGLAGDHKVSARAVDRAGNVTDSETIQVVVER